MDYLDENPIDEVYRIREEILKEYGGIAGWNKHLRETQPQFEKEGWHFVSNVKSL